ASDPLLDERIAIVDGVLAEIGADAEQIVVLNKADLIEHPAQVAGQLNGRTCLTISALRGTGLDRLLRTIGDHFGGMRQEVEVTLNASRGDLVAMARRDGEVLSEEYRDGVVSMRARVSAPVAGRLRKAAGASV
ncbi:MAG TPA: hypothetical protein VGR40_02790, partial [Candidatus Binatus sp.]|nr:hypothetical protein [Candidatus Binatus sp.]